MEVSDEIALAIAKALAREIVFVLPKDDEWLASRAREAAEAESQPISVPEIKVEVMTDYPNS